MAKSTYVANVTLFDGHAVKKRQGVLFGADGIGWVGAHARVPKEASAAREIDGTGKTLLPGLIDVHVHLQFDGSADFEKESKELTSAGFAAIKAMNNAKRNLDAGVTTVRDLGGWAAPASTSRGPWPRASFRGRGSSRQDGRSP
jgi:imidazolonepropionase-like amidohydrolase